MKPTQEELAAAQARRDLAKLEAQAHDFRASYRVEHWWKHGDIWIYRMLKASVGTWLTGATIVALLTALISYQAHRLEKERAKNNLTLEREKANLESERFRTERDAEVRKHLMENGSNFVLMARSELALGAFLKLYPTNLQRDCSNFIAGMATLLGPDFIHLRVADYEAAIRSNRLAAIAAFVAQTTNAMGWTNQLAEQIAAGPVRLPAEGWVTEPIRDDPAPVVHLDLPPEVLVTNAWVKPKNVLGQRYTLPLGESGYYFWPVKLATNGVEFALTYSRLGPDRDVATEQPRYVLAVKGSTTIRVQGATNSMELNIRLEDIGKAGRFASDAAFITVTKIPTDGRSGPGPSVPKERR